MSEQRQENAVLANVPAKQDVNASIRRAYIAPSVLSVEWLEAAAATCTDNTPGSPGKSVPVPCGILGS